MTYAIYQNGNAINTIIASEQFVKIFCSKNGYTYTELKGSPVTPKAPEPSDKELIAAIESAKERLDNIEAAIERGLSL